MLIINARDCLVESMNSSAQEILLSGNMKLTNDTQEKLILSVIKVFSNEIPDLAASTKADAGLLLIQE